jgi:hypothetical protein
MAYTFTTAEIAQIEAARDLCPAGDSDPTSSGNWVPFYQKLSDLIDARIDSGTVTGTDLQDLKNAKLWLNVAIGANGGTGMHSAFIRTYTDRQGELRIGHTFTSAEMQKASNGVNSIGDGPRFPENNGARSCNTTSPVCADSTA